MVFVAFAAVALGVAVGAGTLLSLQRTRTLAGALAVLAGMAVVFTVGTVALAYWSFAVYRG